MAKDDFSAQASAAARRLAELEEAARASSSETTRAAAHPCVAADLAAAGLHSRMFLIQEAFNKEASHLPTRLYYPTYGTAYLTRGSRVVSLRHHLGDWRYFVGYTTNHPEAPFVEVFVDPRVAPGIDGIAGLMCRFLGMEIDALFPPTTPAISAAPPRN